MIIATFENGEKCIYYLPNGIDTVEKLESLIYGYNDNPANREKKGISLLVNSDPRRIRLYTVLC